MSTAIDQAQYKRIEKEFKQLLQHHELILQSAGEGIYGLDDKGHTTFVNKAASEMVGWELPDLIGKSQHSIIHHSKIDGSHYDAKTCPIYAAFNDGKVHHEHNEVFWRKDGSCFPVEYVSTPIKGRRGKLLGAVVVFRDITKRKQSEMALKEANQKLQEALKQVRSLKKRLEQENAYLQQEIKLTHNFEEIISQSNVFKNVLKAG